MSSGSSVSPGTRTIGVASDDGMTETLSLDKNGTGLPNTIQDGLACMSGRVSGGNCMANRSPRHGRPMQPPRVIAANSARNSPMPEIHTTARNLKASCALDPAQFAALKIAELTGAR